MVVYVWTIAMLQYPSIPVCFFVPGQVPAPTIISIIVSIIISIIISIIVSIIISIMISIIIIVMNVKTLIINISSSIPAALMVSRT